MISCIFPLGGPDSARSVSHDLNGYHDTRPYGTY